MGHEASQFAAMDPDLEDENMLMDLVPILIAEIIVEEKAEPQAQCTSILTGRGYVEELFEGNMHSFRTVARMDKATFMRLVTLLRSAGLDDTPHISVDHLAPAIPRNKMEEILVTTTKNWIMAWLRRVGSGKRLKRAEMRTRRKLNNVCN